VQLDPIEAAIAAREVWDLAEEGFYDGLSLHRVVPNFVVQGGDPRGDGWGGAGFVIPDEPSLRPFDSWRVGIATSGPNTGGCQLFFTLLPADHLTGHYSNFGEVVLGRDVLTRLRAGDRIVRITTASGAAPPDPVPILDGFLNWADLAALPGWQQAKEEYAPDSRAIDRLSSAVGNYRLVTVLGTWCSDSEREVPRLVRLLEAIGSDGFDHWIFGVDRSRRVNSRDFPPGLLDGQTAERVPTIIVLDEAGQELGRVVETAEKPIEDLLVEFLTPVEGW
jgi:peptidylprolyl isomerase/peptidyl-prolyl cis-trans isomerase B (cyclophilin B)